MRPFKMLIFAIVLSLTSMLYAQAPSDAQIQGEVQHALDNKRFANVQAAVQDGVVTLSGNVGLYSAKEDADKKVHHLKDVRAVRNAIEVSGGGETMNDSQLRDKLAKGLAYDRVGYGTTTFNNIEIGVQNGVVTLRGTVYGPPDKDSALSLVENTPGVRDVIDELEVAPVSPNDDRIRIAEARAIYGYPALNRYALDPAKTIRITVVNGHVVLNGVVDSKGDKDIAGIRANSVPGVFSVTNNLLIAGQPPEK
jgi:hyperosmotically inducible periplasmic protein